MIIPYCYLSLSSGNKFYSPDETANFVFAKNFAEHTNLKIDIELNKQVNNIIFPRSVNVTDGHFVPMSFLGLPVFYGLIGKAIGINQITFITPILSLLAIFIFYLAIKEIFSPNIGFLSALLLLFNPIYWYLAGKSMLHNNLFIFFVILGLLLLILALKKEHTFLYALAAISFGASIWVRTSEVVWVGLLMFLFYIINRKNIRIGEVLVVIICFCGMLSLLLYTNYLTYDNIFRSGYSSLESQADTNPTSLFFQIILPFGFHLKNIIFHVWEFFIKYLWLITLPAIWGLLSVIRNRNSNLQKFYVLATSSITLYLLIYYGSYWPWGEYGQPAIPEILIGSPHLRYWMPVLVLLTPFISIFLMEVFPRLFKYQKQLKVVAIVTFTGLLIGFSVATVFFNPQEGFVKIQNDIADFEPRISSVNAQIESNAVLIVPEWADRIFFPEHQVIHSWGDKAVYAGDAYWEAALVAQEVPLYYYSANSSEDIETLKQKLTDYDLVLTYLNEIYKGEKLYKITYAATNKN